MRKIFAVIVVFLQLAFPVSLVGISMHKEREIMEKGKDYVLDVQSFDYYEADPERGILMAGWDLAYEYDPKQWINWDEYDNEYWRLVTDADGISRIYGRAFPSEENALNIYSLPYNISIPREVPEAFPFLPENRFLTKETEGMYYYYNIEKETEQSIALDIKVRIRVYKTEARYVALIINGKSFDLVQ